MSLVDNVGFWFAIGIVGGIFIDIGGRLFIDFVQRPILRFRRNEEHAMRKVMYEEEVYLDPEEFNTLVIEGHLVRIDNTGRRAAQNVRATIESTNGERDVCWSGERKESTTINAGDHSYVVVYGVLGDSNPSQSEIVLPFQDKWVYDFSYTTELKKQATWRLRVSAANCGPLVLRLTIDPHNNCELLNAEAANKHI